MLVGIFFLDCQDCISVHIGYNTRFLTLTFSDQEESHGKTKTWRCFCPNFVVFSNKTVVK